jgi:hypothetical protein
MVLKYMMQKSSDVKSCRDSLKHAFTMTLFRMIINYPGFPIID